MIQVTCAIIENGNHVLICQRSAKMKMPLKWEFPGGKLEPGETEQECIVREIREELLLDIRIIRPLPKVTHHYVDFSITLIPFVCHVAGGKLKLKEHKQAVWVPKEQLQEYDWAAADVPVLAAYCCAAKTI